jgi:hypothetical protein
MISPSVDFGLKLDRAACLDFLSSIMSELFVESEGSFKLEEEPIIILLCFAFWLVFLTLI